MVLGAAILAVASAVYAQDDAKPADNKKVRRLGPKRRRHRPRQRRLRQKVHRLPLRRQRLQENRPRPQRHRQARHLHRKQQQSHRRIPQNLDRKRRHHDAPLQRSPRTRPNQRRRRLRQIPLILRLNSARVPHPQFSEGAVFDFALALVFDSIFLLRVPHPRFVRVGLLHFVSFFDFALASRRVPHRSFCEGGGSVKPH